MNSAIAAAPRFRVDRRDRMSAVATLLLTLLALSAAAFLRHSVLTRTKTYTANSGMVLSYPEAWILDDSAAPGGPVRIREARPSHYPAILEARSVAVDKAASDQEVLTAVASTLALNRGREYTALKVYESRTGEVQRGVNGMTSTFVFVDDTGGPFETRLPQVVLGEDRLVRAGSRVYVFTMLTSPAARDGNQHYFDTFVRDARLP